MFTQMGVVAATPTFMPVFFIVEMMLSSSPDIGTVLEHPRMYRSAQMSQADHRSGFCCYNHCASAGTLCSGMASEAVLFSHECRGCMKFTWNTFGGLEANEECEVRKAGSYDVP